MEKKLRKVTFRLNYNRGFEPDQTLEMQKEQEEQERERQGFFHEWASASDDNRSGSFQIDKMGIVEEEETGIIYCVYPDLITFNEKPYEK